MNFWFMVELQAYKFLQKRKVRFMFKLNVLKNENKVHVQAKIPQKVKINFMAQLKYSKTNLRFVSELYLLKIGSKREI